MRFYSVMCMDIMHFQPSVTLEFLLNQTLRCIQVWHRDVMKRYADYSSEGAAQTSGDGMYRDGIYKQPDGSTRTTISIARIKEIMQKGSPADRANLRQQFRGR